MYIHIYIYIYICVCMCVCVCVYMYVYVYVYVCAIYEIYISMVNIFKSFFKLHLNIIFKLYY